MTAEHPTFSIIGSSPVKLWNIDNLERLTRLMARAGLKESDSPPTLGAQLLIRADHVYEEGVIRALAEHPGHFLVTEEGQPVAAHLSPGGDVSAARQLLETKTCPSLDDLPPGLTALSDPTGLASTYNHTLRKRAKPYVLRLTAEMAPAIEKRMFNSAYKGVTDFVTKYVWPLPAMKITRWCARHTISPNSVTTFSLLAMLLAMWFFWIGQFGTGLCCAWLMCFLDTVDGKLARVTLTSSKFGDIFDHGIDLIHPPFWYYAWYVGEGNNLNSDITDQQQYIALWIILAGYLLGRLQEGLFIWLYRIEIHIWKPIDSWFRLITARRNPNLFILTIATLMGEPKRGFIAVAVWTGLSVLFHCWRTIQAAGRRLSGENLHSWLNEPMAGSAIQSSSSR